MRTLIGLGMAMMVMLGTAMTGLAADKDAKAATQTKTGVVRKVDPVAKNIVVMVTRELTFGITEDTKIVQGEAAKTLADIKVGDKVTVEYAFASKDNRVASKVTLTAEAPAKAETPAKAEAPAK